MATIVILNFTENEGKYGSVKQVRAVFILYIWRERVLAFFSPGTPVNMNSAMEEV